MAESENKSCSLVEHFSKIHDFREEHKVLYPLKEILLITICAVIGGADNWVEIETFGKAKKEFFKKLVPLKHGIPSHDTFGDVFASIDHEQFKECFVNWVKSLQEEIKEIVAIDGKCLRHSYDTAEDKSAIYMVSAWANKQNLVLGQEKVSDKSNEITAIPKLLDLLELSGAIVTIDAIGCQKDIARKIIDKKAGYVLALKGNQGNLHEDVELYFEDQKSCNFSDAPHDLYESTDGDHGRVEIRNYGITEDIGWLKDRYEWPGLKSIGFVESKRDVNGKVSTETRYYITSLSADVKQFAEAVRGHWGIENKLHWVLDVNFKDDECRIRKENSPQNFAIVKHVASNLIRQENSTKKSMNVKRHLAGWDDKYLLKVISQ